MLTAHSKTLKYAYRSEEHFFFGILSGQNLIVFVPQLAQVGPTNPPVK